jgi:hypothetical protein
VVLDGVHHEGQEVEERCLAWNKAAPGLEQGRACRARR